MNYHRHLHTKMLSRRSFLKSAGIATGIVIAPSQLLAIPLPVSLGAISYSFRDLPGTAEEILGYMQTLGLSTIELMGTPAEIYAGAPSGGPPPRHPESMTQEERTIYISERRKAQAELQKWRRNAPMEKFAELGEMYRDGGVEIDILKLGSPNWFEEEINYAYRTAKAVGARGISFEISSNSAKRWHLLHQSMVCSTVCTITYRWRKRISILMSIYHTHQIICSI